MGDSTFFHAGIPPLLSYRFNDTGKNPLVVILDNAITAMTGHQPHPGADARIIMVGMATGMGLLPLKEDNLREAIRFTAPREIEKNTKAFELGLNLKASTT